MFTKSNLISTIVTAIWGFLGGFILWDVLAKDFMSNNAGSAVGVYKEMPDFLPLGLGCLISGLVFSLFYAKFSNGNHAIAKGAEFGLLMGVFTGLGHELINYATTNILNLTGMLGNVFIYLVFFVVMGILASIVYNKTSSK